MLKELFFQQSSRLSVQFFRYFIVGGIAAVADIGSLYIFTEIFAIYYLISAALAFIIGVVINYILSFEDNIKSLITHELSNHNIQKPEKESNTKRQKIVIALNEGFLSEETIQQLLNLKTSPDKRPDKEGEKLATSLLEAGLSLTGEQFSKLFEIWQRDKQEQH